MIVEACNIRSGNPCHQGVDCRHVSRSPSTEALIDAFGIAVLELQGVLILCGPEISREESEGEGGQLTCPFAGSVFKGGWYHTVKDTINKI